MGQHNSLYGDTLDTRLTWSPHIDEFRKRTGQRMGMLVPLLNSKSDLSVRNTVLLFEHLVRPLMDYACTARRSAASTHIRRLQLLQSRCLRLRTGAPVYVTGRYTRICVLFFVIHVRSLTAKFDSRLADVASTLLRQLSRYLC